MKQAVIFRIARVLFHAFSILFPAIAARAAFRLFLTPRRHKIPQWETDYLKDAKVGTMNVLGRSVTTYEWGDGDQVVVMCHSWGGRATQLARFIPELTGRGFKVVAFDAIAHGASEGKSTDMMEYSQTIAEVVKKHGPVYGVIGHSFGAGNTLLAWHRFQFPVEKFVLIGCFSSAVWVTERFGEIAGFSSRVMKKMRLMLEDKYNGDLNWNRLRINEMANEYPGEIMLIHDVDDTEIPYFHAQVIMETISGSKKFLMTTKNLGHRRIVKNEQVIKSVVNFLSNRTAAI